MRISLLGIWFLALSLCSPASAQPPMANRVPNSALAYVGWAGRSLVFDGSAMGQLVQEPSVAKMARAVSKLATEHLEDAQAELFSHLWSMASISWQHPIALALVDFQSGKIDGAISGLLLIELGRDRESFQRELTAFLQKLPDEFAVSEESIGPDTFQVVKGGSGHLKQAALGFKESVFFLATDVATVKAFMGLTEEASLQATDKFKQCWSEVDGPNGQLAIYIDVSRILDRLDEATAPPTEGQDPESRPAPIARRVAQALGVDRCTALAYSARIVDRGVHTKMKLFSPAPHRGLLMPLAGPQLGEGDLAVVPGDADFFLAMRASPELLWAELRHSLQMLQPAAEEALDREISQFEKEAGISISQDVLANLGDTLVIASAPSQGGFLTGTVLSLTVKDGEKLSAAIAKIEDHIKSQADKEGAAGGPRMGKYSTGREEISYLTTGDGPSPIAPAWAVHDDRFYMAGWPQVIASVIGRDSATTPVTADPSYRKARSRLPAPASVVSYVNTPKIIRQVYGFILAGWTVASAVISDQTGVAAGVDWLPSLSTLEKYFWAGITTLRADQTGVTFESYGSVPMMAPVLPPHGFPAVLTAVLPSLNRARAEAKKAISTTNLRVIYGGLALYAEDNEGALPADLAALGRYLESTEVFVSPLSGRSPPKVVEGKFAGEIDYIWLGAGNLWACEHPDEIVLAYERPENYRNKQTVVLFADGHVAFMDMPSFKKALARSKELLTKDRPEDF